MRFELGDIIRIKINNSPGMVIRQVERGRIAIRLMDLSEKTLYDFEVEKMELDWTKTIATHKFGTY
jgi:hypothetical protein